MEHDSQNAGNGPRVIVLQGENRLEVAEWLQQENDRLQVLAIREWADDVSKRAQQRPRSVTAQDVNTTAEASLGAVPLIEQVLATMADDAVVVITDLANQGEVEALRAQFDDDLLVVSCDDQPADAVKRSVDAFVGSA